MDNEVKEFLHAILMNQQLANAKITFLQDEFTNFRNDMNEFQNEMYGFKDEMYGFRNDMNDFRTETNQRFEQINRHFDQSSYETRRLQRRIDSLELDLDKAITRIDKLEEQRQY